MVDSPYKWKIINFLFKYLTEDTRSYTQTEIPISKLGSSTPWTKFPRV